MSTMVMRNMRSSAPLQGEYRCWGSLFSFFGLCPCINPHAAAIIVGQKKHYICRAAVWVKKICTTDSHQSSPFGPRCISAHRLFVRRKLRGIIRIQDSHPPPLRILLLSGIGAFPIQLIRSEGLDSWRKDFHQG